MCGGVSFGTVRTGGLRRNQQRRRFLPDLSILGWSGWPVCSVSLCFDRNKYALIPFPLRRVVGKQRFLEAAAAGTGVHPEQAHRGEGESVDDIAHGAALPLRLSGLCGQPARGAVKPLLPGAVTPF